MTYRSEVDSAKHYTIEASYKKGQIFHVESYNVLLFGRVKIQNACLKMNGLYFCRYILIVRQQDDQICQFSLVKPLDS